MRDWVLSRKNFDKGSGISCIALVYNFLINLDSAFTEGP